MVEEKAFITYKEVHNQRYLEESRLNMTSRTDRAMIKRGISREQERMRREGRQRENQ